MAVEFSQLSELAGLGFDTIIDVRSPAEYAEDHIPGAINLPALSNAERAEVGTIYTQDSPFKARKIGAALVARNVAHHLETVLAEKDGAWQPLVYCWRGGQRSGSVATILSQIGWRAETVAGGYRAYRRLVVEALYETPWPRSLMLLDGNTGSGKTALLERLGERGVAVLDLEGLAGHRGSVLGLMGDAQPSQKAFETGIAQALEAAPVGQPIVVEAESSKIGDLIVPPSLWAAMAKAPRILIDAPAAARAKFLCAAYSDVTADIERLCGLLDRLKPFHGAERVAEWQDMARTGAHEDLARGLVERHYDPRYAKARARHDVPGERVVAVDDLGDAGLNAAADQIAQITRSP
jgi:tRNA 2-selenouridine synthase